LHREPIFNVPTVVVALLALLALIHGVREYLLSEAQDVQVLLTFAFIPARYDGSVLLQGWPGGVAANVWTFVTYAFLHANWMHFGVNAIWFLPFGSAVARRFGTLRFLSFLAVAAACGAAVHLATHTGEQYPMIGASAAISGTMAAAMRFAFQRGGPLSMLRSGDAESYHVPALPLVGVFRDARVLLFLAVWFGMNIIFGVGSFPTLTGGESVAWQAHVGGFLAGLLLFSWFDPARTQPSPTEDWDAMRH
jgi:membrane associated rhomboid family serine protease